MSSLAGRDPKPMPPPMKLTEAMLEALGGQESPNYEQFRKLCYTAFLHLRRHANLVLSLVALMAKSSACFVSSLEITTSVALQASPT